MSPASATRAATRRISTGEMHALAHLIRSQRWACLATIDGRGQPLAAMVAYAPSADFGTFLLHLSRLARHTRNLLARPGASLAISAPDPRSGDPQTLPRVSLQGTVRVIDRKSSEHQAAKATYLARLPDAEQLFGFADFVLFALAPARAYYVGGFARAYTLAPDKLASAAAL